MMTTSSAFGIHRPSSDHTAHPPQPPPAPAPEPPKPVIVEVVDERAEKFTILSEALKKFMEKKISKEELRIVQESLK
jgi:hypothetical protein